MTGRRRQLAQSMTVRIAQLGLGMVTGVAIARALQPAGRGEYVVLVTAAATAISLGHLSVPQAYQTQWSTDARSIPANSLLLGGCAGVVAAAVGALALLTVGGDLVPAGQGGLALVALGAVPFGITALYLAYVALLEGRVGLVNRATLMAAVPSTVGVVVLAVAGELTVARVLVIWAFTIAAPLLLLVPGMRLRGTRVNAAALRRTLAQGLRLHPGFAALFLLHRADVFILAALGPAAAVGIYTLAVSLVELTRTSADAVAQVVLAGQADSDLTRSAAVTARATRAGVVLITLTVGGACVAAPLAIPLLYGHAFAAAVPAIIALAPGVFIMGATKPVSNFLLRLERPLWYTGLMIAAMALNVALNLVLIPRWGIVGCAVASSVAYLGLYGAQLVWFLRATGTTLRSLVPGTEEAREAIALPRRLTKARPRWEPTGRKRLRPSGNRLEPDDTRQVWEVRSQVPAPDEIR